MWPTLPPLVRLLSKNAGRPPSFKLEADQLALASSDRAVDHCRRALPKRTASCTQRTVTVRWINSTTPMRTISTIMIGTANTDGRGADATVLTTTPAPPMVNTFIILLAYTYTINASFTHVNNFASSYLLRTQSRCRSISHDHQY